MSAELPVAPSAARISAADQRAADGVIRDSSIQVGRDGLGNVFVTGEGNTVEVKLVDPGPLSDWRRRALTAGPGPYCCAMAHPVADRYSIRPLDGRTKWWRTSTTAVSRRVGGSISASLASIRTGSALANTPALTTLPIRAASAV